MEQTFAKTTSEPLLSQKAQRNETGTILVVDDDPFVVDLLQDYLGGSGYDIITAGSGEEALLKLGSVRVDMALIDLKMPGMDGLETVERVSEIDPGIVTILMTGYPTLDSSVKAMRLGASDYILKPFKLEEVGLSVKKATKERELRMEVKNLRTRVVELEKSIADRKDSIKINKKLGVIATPEGYASKPLPNRPVEK